MAFYHVSFHIDHHHVLGLHILIIHTGWFNNHEPFLPVDAAHISPGENHQAMTRQRHIRLIHFFL